MSTYPKTAAKLAADSAGMAMIAGGDSEMLMISMAQKMIMPHDLPQLRQLVYWAVKSWRTNIGKRCAR